MCALNFDRIWLKPPYVGWRCWLRFFMSPMIMTGSRDRERLRLGRHMMSVVISGFRKLGFHLTFQTQTSHPLSLHTASSRKAIILPFGDQTRFCVIMTFLIPCLFWVQVLTLLYFHILFQGLSSSLSRLEWRGGVGWYLIIDFCPS